MAVIGAGAAAAAVGGVGADGAVAADIDDLVVSCWAADDDDVAAVLVL